MRLIALCALALTGAACATPPEPQPTPVTPDVVALAIDPARIDRARDQLPDGYEVTPYAGAPSPFAAWGFGDLPAADPPPCAALGAPAVDPASARGWSASGPGGIVYAVVAAAADPVAPAPELGAECVHWTVVSGHSTAAVTALPGPDIPAAQTAGMSSAATTVVEGGTETHSHSETFVAYLGDYICFVAVVTDPGAPHPALGPGFGSDLLATTVSTLRG